MRLGSEPARPRSTELLATEVGLPRNRLHEIVPDLAAMGLVQPAWRGVR